MVFNYDWWYGGAYDEKVQEAKRRCASAHFSDQDAADPKSKKFFDELEARTIVYLRDGFSYEIKEIIRNPNTTTLTFECMAADEAYKAGCFVVTAPFDDIARVEVFAVHPDEKPEDMPSIKGFSSASAPPPTKRPDDRAARGDAAE